MCEKNVLTSNGKKLYLVTFEFVSGEYEQSFHRLVYVKNGKDVDNQVHETLSNYYGTDNTSEIDGDDYYYFNSEIAVRYCGWQEITDYKQIVDRLLW